MNTALLIVILIIALTIDMALSIKGTLVTRPTYILRTTPLTNTSRSFSPLTLNQEWPAVGRLVLTFVSAIFGTFLNGFFIASFFVGNVLSRIGNVFLACVGFADIIITCGVLPVPAILIVSGQWDTPTLCYTAQILTEASTYSYSLFFMFVSIETYIRLCRPPSEYLKFIEIRIGILSVCVFIICVTVAGVGVYFGLDYDYCLRQSTGNFDFRITTTIIFHVIPMIVTLKSLLSAAFSVSSRAARQMHYRTSRQYDQDLSTTVLNIFLFFFFAIMWVPYNIVVYFFPYVTDDVFYYSVWVGVSRSVFTSLLFGLINRDFRQTFAHLYNYCCCKNNSNGRHNNNNHNHQRRHVTYTRSTGDVRVHIMHQGHGSNSRGTSTPRDNQDM